MICIRCNHDSTYPNRSQGSKSFCSQCKGEFAFETRTGAILTDKAFQGAIDAVSASGKVRWGVEHLYYEIARRYRKKRGNRSLKWGCGGSVIIVFAGIFVLAAVKAPLWVLLLPLILVWLWALFLMRPSPILPLQQGVFNKMWERWQRIHNLPAGLIVRPETPPKPKREQESDLADYSFDRAIICDRSRTVDLLLANNFHFENNCAILSFGGYPPQAFETVRAMLKRNPHLKVFALHDATAGGCTLASDLARDPAWFKGQQIIDVGLRPMHHKPFKGLFLPFVTKIGQTKGITEDEAKWLSRYKLELAAIRPEQILKRLYKAISKQNLSDRDMGEPAREREYGSDGGALADSSTGSSVECDLDSFGCDADSSDGGSDGFG